MLRRLGSKRRLIPQLLQCFPAQIDAFIDLFFGTGAVSFAMLDRVQYIFANDNDADIFNLFIVLKERREELEQAMRRLPAHEALFKHWKTQEERDPVWRACRFLFFSNFGYLGQPETMRHDKHHARACLLRDLDRAFELIQQIDFFCCDFRDALKKLHWRHPAREMPRAFIYADPPYLHTGNNYAAGFTLADTADLFALLTQSGMRFAISEFDAPDILDLAAAHGLRVQKLTERRNLKNRRVELLITNYDPADPQPSLFSNS